MKVIEESIHFINEGKTVDTRISRCGVAIEHLENLKPFAEKGLVRIEPSIDAKIVEIDEIRTEIATEHLSSREKEALTKVETLATTNSKVKQFAKLKEEIRKFEHVLEEDVTTEFLERADREAHRVELEDYLEKASKAEFKGNKKKALDQYFEALYLLRTDDIPDKTQADRILEIEKKIKELGGEVPRA